MTSELPPGWHVAKVRDVGSVQLGRQRSPDVHHGSNMRPYLRVANVYEDRIDLEDVMKMHFEPREVERFELKPGDILLNEGQSRELVGRPAMYRGELPGACFTNSLVRFQTSEAVDPKFALQLFRHWMKSGAFQSIGQITTNIAHLGAGRFGDMDFPVPPLNEQRRIVAKLDDIQGRSRRAKVALDAVQPLLEKLRQSILAAAFRGDLTADWRAKHPEVEPAEKLLARIRVERRRKWEEAELGKLKGKGRAPTDDAWKAKYKDSEPVDATGLPELPVGWCWASVDEIATRVTDGTHQSPAFVSRGVPFLVIGNVAGGRIDWPSVSKWVSQDTYVENTSRCTPARGDVLYTAVGSYGIALAVDTDQPFMFQRHIAHIKPLASVVRAEFLTAMLNAPFSKARADDVARGVAQKTVTLGELSRFPIPVPPLEEQAAVLERLGAMLATATGKQTEVSELATSFTKLERSVLAKAFRGELVPQDPNDEPAEVMLARVRCSPNEPAGGRRRRVG